MKLLRTWSGNSRMKMSRILITVSFFSFLFVFSTFSLAQTTMTTEFMLPKVYNSNEDGFIVIAHRGASAYYPENTMASFRGAVEMGAEMIELDVMLSRDGVPVVFHDAELEDHSDGIGPVGTMTIEELKKLDVGSWFDEKFSDQRMPTLEEVLEFASGTIALNIEIKTEAVTDKVRGGIEEKALRLVKKYDMREYVLFSSFDYRAVAHLKELAPDIPVALLYNKNISDEKMPSELVREFKADAFNCSYGELNKKRLADIKAYEIPVFVYTVNQKRRMRRLIKKGVTGIFSDKPDLLKEVAESISE